MAKKTTAKRKATVKQGKNATETETTDARDKRLVLQIIQLFQDERVSVMAAASMLMTTMRLLKTDAPVTMPSEEKLKSWVF